MDLFVTSNLSQHLLEDGGKPRGPLCKSLSSELNDVKGGGTYSNHCVLKR
jgi:hypothetical protein